MNHWLYTAIIIYYNGSVYPWTWVKFFLFLGLALLQPKNISVLLGMGILFLNFKFFEKPVAHEVIVAIYLMIIGSIAQIQQTENSYNILQQYQITYIVPVQQVIAPSPDPYYYYPKGPLKKNGTPDMRYKANWF